MNPQMPTLTAVLESANLEGFNAGQADGFGWGLVVGGVALVGVLAFFALRPAPQPAAQPLQPTQPTLPMASATTPAPSPTTSQPVGYAMA